MEEIYRAEAAYLWQYLTRSSAAGYFLALSGGLDSATVALFVFGMAKAVLESINSGDANTLAELRRITGEPALTVEVPQDIVKRLFHTCYMAAQHSGSHTRSRARRLAESIGAYHSDVNIDGTVAAHENIVEQALNFKPKFKVEGGSAAVGDFPVFRFTFVNGIVTNKQFTGEPCKTEHPSAKQNGYCIRGECICQQSKDRGLRLSHFV
jgi:NAD+ synthase (glutamine-hydrolysing)